MREHAHRVHATVLAAGTLPRIHAGERHEAFRGRQPRCLGGCRRHLEERTAPGERLGLGGVGEEAEVPDADRAVWKDVQQEAPDELLSVQRDRSRPSGALVVAAADADALSVERRDAVVADGDAMGVAAKVVEGVSRPVERGPAIDDPIFRP